MRGVRTFLIVVCLGILVGGVIHRHRSHRPIPIPPGADSAQTALFQAIAAGNRTLDPTKIKIDLNQADVHEIIALPGIGPVRAAAIVEYRESHGSIHHLNDLLNIKGIGPKTIERITPYVKGIDITPQQDSEEATTEISKARSTEKIDKSEQQNQQVSDTSESGLGLSLQLQSAPVLSHGYIADSYPRHNDLPFPSPKAAVGNIIVESDSIPAKININQATEEQLVALPGIGPVKAKAIVEYRKSHGPFHHPEDLLQVKGIGAKTLEKIKPQIILNDNNY
jgi:competence protein ComEA